MAPPVRKKKKFSSDNRRLISSAAIGEDQQQTLGSLTTSSGKRQSVRMAKKIKKRILRKIWICSDVWMDIFPFFNRAQLGLKLALISPRFGVLVDKHFDGKSELPLLRTISIFKDDGMSKIFVDGQFKRFPLPKYRLPNKIRFSQLKIWYIDHSVIAFLRSNKLFFDGRGTNLQFYIFSSNNVRSQPIWNVFVREIWPFFAPNIRHLCFLDGAHLDNLLRLSSPTLLTDLNQLNSIRILGLPEVIGGFDGPNATSASKAMSKWLHTPTKDGKPKLLRCRISNALRKRKLLINSFKKTFRRATTSVNFIVHFGLSNSKPLEPFELVNEQTKEKLTLSKESEDNWLINRCQIGQIIQWEYSNWDKLNNVSIYLSDVNCIGPLLSPPAAEKGAELCGSKTIEK